MKINLIKIISAPLLATTALSSCTTEQKMNVLFIAVDDMNNDLGCYGHQVVKSPGIDRLAREGIAFANAYCQFPLSSPSRSSLLTGLYPDRTRVFNLTYHFRQGLPDVTTLPQMFMDNDYYVARVGKMYHYGNPGDIGTDGLDDRESWGERYNPAGRDKTTLELDIMNYTPKRGLGSSLSFYNDREGVDADHTDGKVATEVIKLMAKHKDEPFFIGAGFYKPHCPYVTPGKYFDMYNISQITLPEISQETPEKYPSPALAFVNPWPYFGVAPDSVKECKLAYYAAISFVDAQVNRLLDALDSLGLADNTIVVFWSDHGYHLGEHGLWFKQSCFEESAKCPLIISVPGMRSNGKLCRRTVQLVDIYPTLSELTGLTPPKDLDGHSLVSLLKDPEGKWNHPAYTQVQRGKNPGHSVRTEKWRYTEWGFGDLGAELYDEVSDPQELTNLAGDPQHAGIVLDMKALLKKVHPEPVTGGTAADDARKRFSNDPVKQFEIVEAWRTDTLLQTPESVILDKKRDILYVTNLNFEPRKKDGNGFISKMDKTGKITELHWIEGLSSPKGMAIVGDTLFAADVDEIVLMDINKGEIIRKIPIKGAGMLNDITSDDRGSLYFSDTDRNKIHKYSGGKVTEWLTSGLNGPNGLLYDGSRLLVASQGGNDFASFDLATKTRTLLTEGVGRGDGIAFTGIPGYYIVTDWEGEIFMVNPDNSKVSLLRTKEAGSNTADIEYIKELNLLLVPTFFKNCIVAYKLVEK